MRHNGGSSLIERIDKALIDICVNGRLVVDRSGTPARDGDGRYVRTTPSPEDLHAIMNWSMVRGTVRSGADVPIKLVRLLTAHGVHIESSGVNRSNPHY